MNAIAPPPVALLKALRIAWPSFLVAGVQDAVLFSLVDPASVHAFGDPTLHWPPEAVYSLGFLALWASTAAACALCEWLRPHGGDARF